MVFKCFNCHATDNLYAAPHTQEMRERWLELFPEGDMSMFNETFRICAEHFDNKYILPTGLLSTRAVPTKFLVHNVWCEIEDENDEQQNNQSEQQMDTGSDDDKDSSISATDSEILVKSLVDQRASTVTESRLSNIQNENSTISKNDNLSSSVFHTPNKNSNASAIVSQTKANNKLTSNVNHVSFFAHDETLNSGKKSTLDTEGSLLEGSKTNHFKCAAQSTPSENKRESREHFSFSKDSTFHTSSPEMEDKKPEQSRKSLQSSSSTSKRLKEKHTELKPCRLSYSPPRNSSGTPKPILSHSRKAHKKRVKFHPKVKFAPFSKTLPVTSLEKERKSSDNNAIKSKDDILSESSWQTKSTHDNVIEIKNEETYSVKRRKKMPIVLLKRLRFPRNLVPRLGTMLDIREMGMLNNFKVSTENDTYPTKQEYNMFSHTLNGSFNLNGSMNISTTIVDLTLDDSDTNDSPKENNAVSRLASPTEVNMKKENNSKPDASNCASKEKETRKEAEKSVPDMGSVFDVREDLSLTEQLNFYNAELTRVKKVQTALYKQYRTYNDKFTKLQNFLDQLAKNGLIMKRDQ